MRHNHQDREIEHYRSIAIALGERCRELQTEVDSLRLELACRVETDVWDLAMVGARMN